jgi:TonB family protein
MRPILLALSALFLASCARDTPPPPDVTAEIQAFDRELDQGRKSAVIQEGMDYRRDFRDRTIEQDLAQWVFAKPALDRIDEAKRRAAKAKNAGEARPVIAEARKLLTAELGKVPPIIEYWTGHAPGPYWRTYWNDLFAVNNVAVKDPDPMLVTIEKRTKESLDRGDFEQAGKEIAELVPVLVAALDRTAGSLTTEVAPPTFLRRKSACTAGATPDRSRSRPKLADAKSVNDFYPAEAIQRGETGTVVMRVRVDAKGCANQVALVVQTGVRSIDAAALEWFETAQFSPAWIGGRAAEAELMFKLKFVLNE